MCDLNRAFDQPHPLDVNTLGSYPLLNAMLEKALQGQVATMDETLTDTFNANLAKNNNPWSAKSNYTRFTLVNPSHT